MKKFFKYLGLFILVIIGSLAVYNLILSQIYKAPENQAKLSGEELREMAFVYDFKQTEGEKIWPGLSNTEIPFIQFNDACEFLFKYDAPGDKWVLIDGNDQWGGNIYRREAINPQAFAVELDQEWVGSLGTKDQMNRSLFLGIRKEVPKVISYVFPFFIFKVSDGMHIAGTFHEMFHAFQAINNESKFLEAENAHADLESYPYYDEDFVADWNKEGKLLYEAVHAEDEKRFLAVVDSFLLVRENRRNSKDLAGNYISAEKKLEWLEGMAKYVEYRSYILAAEKEDVPYKFKTKNAYWQMEQKDRLSRLGKHGGDNRFYSSGAAQAFILDRLNADWKTKIMRDGIYLEDLIREVRIR